MSRAGDPAGAPRAPRLCDATPADSERLFAAWSAASAASGARVAPFDRRADWERRWRGHPLGSCGVLAEGEGGEVLSFQAALPVEVSCHGRRERWMQLADGCARPGSPGGLHHAQAFTAASAGLIERVGGPSPGAAPVLYCMPPRRAHRLADAFLGCEVVTNAKTLGMDPGWLGREATGGIEIEEAAAFPGEVDELFARVEPERAAIAVRDARFLGWRFDQRPERGYRRFLARGSGGTLLGYAVYGQGELEGHAGGALCDWLVAGGDARVTRALRGAVAERAAAEGPGELRLLLPETSPEWLEFQSVGFRVRPTARYVVARTFERRRDAEWLFWNWSFTLADFGA